MMILLVSDYQEIILFMGKKKKEMNELNLENK